ncbi:hypothetical protein [Bacillus sp. FSL K6-1284]|uniref:hypothetical protein n=1 Tax=Bacillus sp. FSL K6-1284 TaxID=2921468 RepID=UPI0030F91236
MDKDQVLQLVKARLGISTAVRDTYLTAIINGVITELTGEKGVNLQAENANHLMFVVDYSTWRYQNKDNTAGLPRHLQFRLHNLFIHNGGGADGDV